MTQTVASIARPRGGPRPGRGMEILFLAPAYDCRYPSETMWQRLRALGEVGQVRVAPITAPVHDCLDLPPQAIFESPAGRRPMRTDLFGYPARIEALARRIEAPRGVIWANSNLFTRSAAFRAARITGWPVVIDVWDVPDLPMWSQLREGHHLKSLVHRAMSYRLARDLEAASLVVWTLDPDSAERYFRSRADRLLPLYNGIRGAALEPFRTRRSSSIRQLFYMGHFRRSRGSQLMVETLARLSGEGFRLQVVGDTGSADSRRAIAAIAGDLAEDFEFSGHMPWDQAMERAASTGICLYPFPHSPELEYIYPLKLLEYASLGKWIVSSDLAGARRLLSGYRRVRFADPGDPDAWAVAIRGIAAGADESGAAPDGFQPAKFDWDRINGELIERVNTLVHNSFPLRRSA